MKLIGIGVDIVVVAVVVDIVAVVVVLANEEEEEEEMYVVDIDDDLSFKTSFDVISFVLCLVLFVRLLFEIIFFYLVRAMATLRQL